MKEFISKNFQFCIVIALFIILMVQRCGSDGKSDIDFVKRDTTVVIHYHHYDDTTKTKPQIVNVILPKQSDIPPAMIPDGTYTDLKKKYDSLLIAYYTKNIQQDSIKVDTFGYVKTLDTVNQNKIIGRQWITDLKIPEKTITITETKILSPKTQVYLGFSLTGNQNLPLNGASIGGLLKNKKEQIYGAKVGLMNKVGVYYEASSYWNLNKIFR